MKAPSPTGKALSRRFETLSATLFATFSRRLLGIGAASLVLHLSFRAIGRMRQTGNFVRLFKLIWVVQSSRVKYCACAVGQIRSTCLRVPHSKRGALRIVTNVGRGMRWTRGCRTTNGVLADGEAVWFWRPDADAKFCGAIQRATVARKPGYREERGISRKTIAQGMPDCFGGPVVTTSCAFFTAHETAGARNTRHSLRPPVREGQYQCGTRAQSRRGKAKMRALR
jgi:hypothetical protein